MKTTLPQVTVSEQLVAFADLSGFHRRICRALKPDESFAFLTDYYATVQRAVDGSNGEVVKFIGDAILLLFPAADPQDAVAVLKSLKSAVDAFLAERGYDSRLRIKAHVGEVACGRIGGGALERFDVCGLTVNQTALLPEGEWVLSEELRKRLGG